MAGGRVLYYLDETGRKVDANLHEGLLDDPEVERMQRRRTYEEWVRRGGDPAEGRRLFGLEE